MKSTGILARSMAALGLAFLLLSTGLAPADVEIVGITGTAEQVVTKANDRLSFRLKIETDKNLAPGIRYYPFMRIIFADGTWIHAEGWRFRGSMRPGRMFGGSIQSCEPVGRADRAVRIEVVATFGEPNKFFLPEEFGSGFRRLSDKTLDILKRAGGFVISIPVVPAK
ncbi:MAG: hypothetical protein K8R23_14210 [Chthoniobacter sp.]|nr:hypothetical protein [Chthoniobacter sp.]